MYLALTLGYVAVQLLCFWLAFRHELNLSALRKPRPRNGDAIISQALRAAAEDRTC
jgi:hypothetical protein